jgi:RNA polymerase sigma factor (TIGR02999 family)
MDEITEWIRRARAGDAAANERLYEAVYDDLRQMAGQLLKGSRGEARPTSLVHETYLRLAKASSLGITDRRHFFAVAAKAMRQLVVDRVRAKTRHKRGGADRPVSLTEVAAEPKVEARAEEALAIDQALDRLAAIDASLAELVELRFFADLTLEEIAELHQRSERSLKRDWRKARAFLHAQLGEGASDGG